ncbi:MAG: FAD binding domain-containing protein [Chloroflexota bacterium]
MITAYHRPQSLDEALQLISRSAPKTVPLGGGTVLSHHRGDGVEVVDLQALGLNRIAERGRSLDIGATVTLQQLLESPSCPGAMVAALRLETPLNLRNSSSIAGTLMVCDGRSSFVTLLLALDARVAIMHPTAETVPLGELLPLRNQLQRGFLITGLELPRAVRVEFDYVARTPADRPIVAAAVARWPSGRIRLALGGFGPMPLLALDGTDADELDAAARNAMHEASDPWGSAEYRMDVAATLTRRCLDRFTD